MLAYIFWHWPRPQVAAGEYETDLIAFHATLAADRHPASTARSPSASARCPGWVTAGGYEDWYVVDGSAVLDPLNAAAVSGRRKPSHDRAVQAAAGGAGGTVSVQSGHRTWPTRGTPRGWVSRTG